jgi:hypothetical protein
LYNLVVLCETNVLNPISQRLDTIYQINPKRATIHFSPFSGELNTAFVLFMAYVSCLAVHTFFWSRKKKASTTTENELATVIFRVHLVWIRIFVEMLWIWILVGTFLWWIRISLMVSRLNSDFFKKNSLKSYKWKHIKKFTTFLWGKNSLNATI